MEEGSEMEQSPIQGDKDKNNSVWHVRSVYFVPGPVLRALCGASQRQAVSYTPTVFERLTVNLQMKGKPVNLQIWDTAGQVDYDRLRPLFYPDASVLLLCFDVTSPHSFDNVFNRWYPEVNHFCKEVPIIVVGCKTDLRKDRSLVKKLRKNRLEPVTYHRGQEMARSVGAVAYLECSALLHENVHAVFQEAAEVALSSRSRNLWRRITRSFCVVT
ncbi:rho-related GTP-binding protein RhoD isoform X1 [Pteropus medius]|uniref:rho-related GTP-binding protein RhoD isoform X1 n=1 Tax=Pteropus vampyrus TaxID=132908 RepID=UPI00196B8672|nr:rho-related GTP-binding protein RhoD isoform X1 [Pteropus giganteus]